MELSFDYSSLLICKARGYWYFTSELFSQWLMVALVSERLFIIAYPFKGIMLSTTRHAVILAISVFVTSSCQAIPVIFAYNLVEVPEYIERNICLPLAPADSFIGLILTFVSYFSLSVYSTVSLSILTAILAYKLMKISRQHNKLMTCSRNVHMPSKKDINVSVSIITLSLMQCALYIPSAIFYGSYSASNIIKIFTSTRYFWFVSGRFFLSITIISKIWNIYVYLVRVPSFKEDLFKIITCSKQFIKKNSIISTGLNSKAQ